MSGFLGHVAMSGGRKAIGWAAVEAWQAGASPTAGRACVRRLDSAGSLESELLDLFKNIFKQQAVDPHEVGNDAERERNE